MTIPIPPGTTKVSIWPRPRNYGQIAGDGVAGILVWGVQLEADSGVSSYIPATNRAADLIAIELGGFRLYTEGT